MFMDSRNSNIVILALGLSYLIIAIFLFVKHVNIHIKFFFIIAISSLFVSMYELFNSTTKSLIKINSTLLNKIYNNSTKSELLSVKSETDKIERKISFFEKANVFCKLITYISVFTAMIIIPFLKISNDKLQFSTNIFSIFGFALIFISIYINSNTARDEEIILNNFEKIELKYINKKVAKGLQKSKTR